MPSNAFNNAINITQDLYAGKNDGVLQVVTNSSNTGKNPISTSYTEIAGSKIAITPKMTGSVLVYHCNVQLAHRDSHGITHFWIQTSEDNATWTNRVRRSSSVATTSQSVIPLDYYMTGGNVANDARYIRVAVRAYATGNEDKLGQTYYWDGASSSQVATTITWCMEVVNQQVVT